MFTNQYLFGTTSRIENSSKRRHEKPLDSMESLQKMATQGDPKAQYFIGFMYYYGKGTCQDKKKAFEWFQKSAEQGDLFSQHFLDEIYRNEEKRLRTVE